MSQSAASPNRWPAFVVAMLLVLGTGAFLRHRAVAEVIAWHVPLATLPAQIGDWIGTDYPIDAAALQVLGPGDFLLRVFRNRARQVPDVDLFIAYFPSQKSGDSIHSPKDCLPGAGWAPVKSEITTLRLAGGAPFPANRYVIAKGGARQLVLYWYQAHGRAVASEYWAKFYLVADSIRLNRTDGALVRLITPVAAGESEDQAEARILSLADRLPPLLATSIPQ